MGNLLEGMNSSIGTASPDNLNVFSVESPKGRLELSLNRALSLLLLPSTELLTVEGHLQAKAGGSFSWTFYGREFHSWWDAKDQTRCWALKTLGSTSTCQPAFFMA